MTLRRLRQSCIALLAMAAGGCGFHPLYGTTGAAGAARQEFSSIYVDTIQGERIGYDLRNYLINNLRATAKPNQALYRLSVTLVQYIQGIAIENDATVTRYNYTLNAKYELTDMHTNKVIKSGIESTLSAYDVVASPYATLAAEQDAQKRGANDVAYRIQIDLAAYFAKHPAQAVQAQ